MSFTPDDFLMWAHSILRTTDKSYKESHRKFKSTFGTSTTVASILWEKIEINDWLPNRSNPSHLLFALLFLRKYETEEMNSILSGHTEKTFRNWIHLFVPLLAQIQTVSRWPVLIYSFFTNILYFHSLHLRTEKTWARFNSQELTIKSISLQLMEPTAEFKNQVPFPRNITHTSSKVQV